MPECEIRARGRLDPSLSAWLGDLAVHPTGGGETILSGPVVDQAALPGVLTRIRGGLPRRQCRRRRGRVRRWRRTICSGGLPSPAQPSEAGDPLSSRG
jgi:hypothetical protein